MMIPDLIMLTVHPVLQSLSIVAAIYVLFLGINRFRVLHFYHKSVFKWKRHVVIGTVSLGILFVGMFSAMSLVYLYWRGFLITGAHGFTALVMLPLLVFGLVSGHYMNRFKKKRRILPTVHGINNLIIVLLALRQIASGWWVYNAYVLGG